MRTPILLAFLGLSTVQAAERFTAGSAQPAARDTCDGDCATLIAKLAAIPSRPMITNRFMRRRMGVYFVGPTFSDFWPSSPQPIDASRQSRPRCPHCKQNRAGESEWTG
jgi:hypothetical protein